MAASRLKVLKIYWVVVLETGNGKGFFREIGHLFLRERGPDDIIRHPFGMGEYE